MEWGRRTNTPYFQVVKDNQYGSQKAWGRLTRDKQQDEENCLDRGKK